VRGADFGVVGDACVGIVGAMIGDWLLPRFNVRFVGGVMGLAVEVDRGSRAVAGSALGWRERMGRGSLGVRRSAARLLLTKRELSLADGLRSKVREAHADESDASRRRENRPD
jgi:hypothetical protein